MSIKGIALLFVSAVSVVASVTITESTTRRLSFTFEMTGFSITTLRKAGGDFSQLSFSSANTVLPGGGTVAFPALSLYAGVPQTGNVSAYVVSHSVKRVALDHPLCRYHDSVSSDTAYPACDTPWLSRIEYRTFGDLRTAHFYLMPFLYDPSTRTLTILEKGSCVIEFPDAPVRTKAAIPLRSDFYSMMKSMILNYDVAKNWIETKRPVTKRVAARTYLPAQEKMLRFKIGDGNTNLNEGTTNENGVVKIRASDIAPFFGSTVPVNSIALYASYKEELGSTAPLPDSIPSGVREVPVMRFDRNKNGIFDADDYFLAYVSGVCDWYFDTARIVDTSDSSKRDFAFNQNRVENERYYWIRTTGSNCAAVTFTCNAGIVDTVTSFENRVRYKMVKGLSWGNSELKGGMNWIWKRLDSNATSFSYSLPIDETITDSACLVRINKGTGNADNAVSVVFDGTALESKINGWMTVNRLQNAPAHVLAVTLNSLSLYLEIESVDLKYNTPLDMKGRERLRVYSAGNPGILAYRLNNVRSGRLLVFRLDPCESSVSVIDTTVAGGAFFWTDTAGAGVQYYICTEAGILNTPVLEEYKPSVAATYEIKDLRNGKNSADYLIITRPVFSNEAIRLADHKAKTGMFKCPAVVYADDIFREFSGGSGDPAAIRNFLLYTHHAANWTVGPEYVVLFGNGHYDYKGYSTREVNHIPTAQFWDGRWMCMEDFFACITPGELIIDGSAVPDLFLGRLPCYDVTEARSVVNKIFDSEGADADYSGWRNRALLVSDDDMQGTGFENMGHCGDNEEIDTIVRHERPATDVRKVILFEYPFNELHYKPEAGSALVNEINNGVCCVNFIGHGSEVAWTDENIFNTNKVRSLHNYKQYPLINAFSCSVGYFDKPGESCLSDLLVTTEKAGAIASISSTRTAYAGPNVAMAKTFHTYYYNKDSSRTIGQAYAITKATNNLKQYALLGDPSIRHSIITDTIELVVSKESGGLEDDTLMALQRILVTGSIKRNGALNQSFGTSDKPASVFLGLFNPPDTATRKDGGTYTKPNPKYLLPGRPLFLGTIEVKQGRFEQKIQVPKRVTFYRSGAKITAFAWNNGESFGAGYKGSLLFDGTDTSNVVFDNTGPRITIRPVYENAAMWNTPVGFTDKICGLLPIECEICVWDQSGVDVSGTGPDEGLSVEVEGTRERQNINNKFKFDQGKYTRGGANIVFERDDLKPGQYTMTVRAQDLAGNCTKSDFTLEILTENDFKLDHVFNYPNPTRMNGRTKFYFYHSSLSEQWYGKVEATIRIFTLSGKLIRIFHNAANGQEWDLTDQRGNRLTPNVYLYRVSAKMLTGDISGKEKVVTSPVKKVVVQPPG